MGSPEGPEGRGLKHASAVPQFLLRTKAINDKLHLAPACFRSRRDAINLIRAPLNMTSPEKARENLKIYFDGQHQFFPECDGWVSFDRANGDKPG